MTETTHNNALQAGYQLHWYTIQSVLGQGAFGITYLAHDINLDRLVAIKEYMPGQFSMRVDNETIEPISGDMQNDYQSGLQRFLSEARILTMFQHPNLVQVFNIFEQNNTAYMVMSYESGRSLKQILKSRKILSELELMRILVPLLDGIEMMHRKGYIHRDIKPGNIFIRADNTPVLLDFGSARQTHYYFSEDDDSPVKTLTNFVSPGYTPIEQYTGKSDRQGPWTDIYSLGATLYKAITGKMPIEAVERSESLLHVEKDEYQPLIHVAEGNYSKSFLCAIDHALAFKAHERPQTIPEWKKEFGITEDDIDTIELPTYQLNKIQSEYSELDSEEVTAEVSSTLTKTLPISEDTENTAPTVVSLPQQRTSLVKRCLNSLPYAVAASLVLATIVIINLDNTAPDLQTANSPSTFKTPAIPAEETLTSPITLQKPVVDKESTPAMVSGINSEQFLGNTVNALASKNQLQQQNVIEEKLEPVLEPNPKQERINTLLAKAADNISRNQLTVPEDNNAVYHYQQVLNLDADNADAKRGLLLITDKFMIKAYRAIEDEQFSRADNYINKADRVTPNIDAVRRAREYLAVKQKQQRNKTVVVAQTPTAPTSTQKNYDNGIKVVDLSRDVPQTQKQSVPDNGIDRTLNAIENFLE